ncbi:MAG: citryl-CoA lyase [Halorientalis sp.]
MSRDFETRLSDHDSESITFREKDLATEVMDEMTFTETLYYMWTGEEATETERRLLDMMVTSLMVHGVTPSSIVSRLTLLTEPDAVQNAVGAAVNGVGSQFVGTMKECAEDLAELSAAEDRDAAVEALVTRYGESDDRFAGIGHPDFDPIDPRAEKFFEVAEEGDVAGEHVALLRDVQAAFEDEVGTTLPINATGAIAAVTLDMGLSPTAARGIAIVSRATGVVAEILEEQENPMAFDIWQEIDEQATRPE